MIFQLNIFIYLINNFINTWDIGNTNNYIINSQNASKIFKFAPVYYNNFLLKLIKQFIYKYIQMSLSACSLIFKQSFCWQ